ncbi:MMPL family transporter [Curtobacterium sp. VKM Ac-2887]|nr:MMPL family transporter [Curtobacterium sp. VKM Ac-2887]
MARLLHRLGRFSAHRPWVVIVAWIVILLGAGGAWLGGHGTLTSEISIPGTATEKVQDRLEKILDGSDQGSSTIVVHTADGDRFTAAQRSDLAALIKRVGEVEGVDTAADPFASAADRAAQAQKLEDATAQVTSGRAQLAAARTQLTNAIEQAKAAGTYDQAAAQFDAQKAQLVSSSDELDDQASKLEQGKALADMAEDIRTVSKDGSTAIVSVTFDASAADVTDSVKEHVRDVFSDDHVAGVDVDYAKTLAPTTSAGGEAGEIVGIVVAAIVLIIMLGTLVAAGLPLLNALLGVGVSVLVVLAFSKLVDMNETTPVLGLMLGLAVGIDYSLFIINRHRTQLREGIELRESIALANGTSGTAVVFAGSTVVIALLALWVTGIPLIGMMGVAGAAAVAAAVLIAITLTPALLSLMGHRVLPKRAWRTIALGGTDQKSARAMSTGRAVITTIASVVVLGVVALPALQMRLGLPDDSSEPHSSTQYRAFEQIDNAFGPGQNSPLVVVADLPEGVSDGDLTADEVSIGQRLMALDHVDAVAPAATSDDNSVIVYQLLPTGGAQDASTEQLVHDVRDLTMDDGDVTFSVAGSASGNIDISEKIAQSLPPYLAIVIGLSILIMIMVFRSILVPVIATAGFVLSLASAIGGVTAIFQFGWLGGLFGVDSGAPVLSILPTLLVGILFGLAMDYQLFIASGIREAFVHGSPARVAVTKGVNAGRTVVTAAAIIMAAVFAGFIFGGSSVVKPLGFGLAFGVLIDAFVVRMLLIPAVLHLLGRAAWWLPKWIDRILPDVDVEGASLDRPVVASGARTTGVDADTDAAPERGTAR